MPGHPLFEAVRDDVAERVRDDLKRGAVFYDLQAKAPVRFDVFGASVKDGRGNTVSRRLFIVQAEASGALTIRQPTYLAELAFAPVGTPVPNDSLMPDRSGVEQALVEKALNPFLEEIATQRAREVETIALHLEISLGELIHRANMSLAELANRRIEGENIPGLEGNIAQAEAHLDELNNRLEGRRAELAMERQIALSDNEYKTAERLKTDYWLYVVFNCGTKPELHLVHDPARLGWQPVVQVAHYHLESDAILNAEAQ